MQRIRLFLFGPPRVERDNHPVELKRRKTAALLAYIALNPRPTPRETLAGLLWPDADQASAFAYLRHTLWEIGSDVGPAVLQTTRDTVKLADEQEIGVDVLRFENLLSRWKNETTPELLEEAVGLYQADFLDRFFLKDSDEFDVWQREKAEGMRTRFCKALEALAGIHLAGHDAERALLHARRWLGFDNLNEAAHCMVIRAELLGGRRSAALRQYEACAHILSTELGVDPAPSTRALLDEIRLSPVEAVSPAAAAPHQLPSLVKASSPLHINSTNLPKDPTPFIGRRMELSEIAYRLKDPDCRLLTLLGPGGIGKTRLALRAADEMAANYPDGVSFVPLVALNQPDQFLTALASAVHLQTDPSDSEPVLLGRLSAYLGDKTMLILLDNMELLTASAQSLQTILTASPKLNILVTSRERLNLAAEWCFEVGGMSYPFGSEGSFEEYSAVQLFLHTARRVKADFQLDPGDRAAIARICRLVEGLPLGVELAATWTRLLSPGEILREIENSLDFLTSGQRGIPERHRSLRSIYEGSREMLSSAERLAFQRLAVLPGRFSRDAAIEVGVDLHLLSALVDKTLVRFHSDGRYDLHEVLRKYAVEDHDNGIVTT